MQKSTKTTLNLGYVISGILLKSVMKHYIYLDGLCLLNTYNGKILLLFYFLLFPLEPIAMLTFFLGGCIGGGAQRRQLVSTVSVGRLYSDDFRCSSTNLGVTQITCWPFQYFTKFSDCRVLIISACVIDVILLRSLILNVPLKSRSISNNTQDQYER